MCKALRAREASLLQTVEIDTTGGKIARATDGPRVLENSNFKRNFITRVFGTKT